MILINFIILKIVYYYIMIIHHHHFFEFVKYLLIIQAFYLFLIKILFNLIILRFNFSMLIIIVLKY